MDPTAALSNSRGNHRIEAFGVESGVHPFCTLRF